MAIVPQMAIMTTCRLVYWFFPIEFHHYKIWDAFVHLFQLSFDDLTEMLTDQDLELTTSFH